MSTEYETLHSFIARIRAMHQEAYCAFKVYEQLNELRAPNIVGQEVADRNAAAMSGFTGFFSSAERALNLHFLITIAKIFDYSSDALRIEKLINFAEQNQKKLTAKEFQEFHKDRQYIEDLAASYEGINKDDLLDISKRLDAARPIIEKIKVHRDTKLAHEDLKKKSIEDLTYAEIEEILNLSHDILNIFSSKTSHETTSYMMLEKQSIEDTQSLIGLIA
jgi:hypothetical protein